MLNIKDAGVKFVYEYLFVLSRECGKETEFLRQWEASAPYFELNGIYDSEKSAIGLAAAKAGLPVRWDAIEGISFFKDRTELVKIKKGQSDPKEMSSYFEKQKMLEYPKRAILKKLAVKLAKNFGYVYRSLRLRSETLKNFDFYYR